MKQKNTVLAYLALAIVATPSARLQAAQVLGNEAIIGANHQLTPNVYNSILGGQYNTNYAYNYSSIGGGNLNIIADTQASVIGGGIHNVVDPNNWGNYLVVSGGQSNRIQDISGVSPWTGLPTAQKSAWFGTIGGGHGNRIFNSYGSTVSGGIYNIIEPWVNYSVISGGSGNLITYGSGYSAISGGTDNKIMKGAWWGAINGGQANWIWGPLATTNTITAEGALDFRHWGWIGGGLQNGITGPGVVGSVGGGFSNIVSGYAGTIAGGALNAAAAYAQAGGFRAKALNQGSFVWADSNNADFSSTANNQFSVRSYGGARFITGSGPTNGVTLAAGGGSWATLSDRNAKTDFASVNKRQILSKLSNIHIGTWRYKAQDEDIRHIGPIAQDFHQAFGVGENEVSITTIDADGVALASIQALHEMLQEKEARIQAQEDRLRKLEERLAAIPAE
jgi:trimeric autotransporter adhesin